MVPAPGVPPPDQPARGRGQAPRGGFRGIGGGVQATRGGGQPVGGRPRDVVQSDRAQPQSYAFLARPEAEASDVVITGTILVYSRDVSVLFDPGSTYSYVSSYFATFFVVHRDSLSAPVYVSTLIGNSIIVDRVYRSCVVIIGGLETRVDLLLLDMADFDVILGMDWLPPYHVIFDCHAKTMTLALSGLPRLEWRGTPGHSTSRVISYMKGRHMVEKGCLDYLAYVCDSSVEVPSMDSVPVVCEFPEIFLTNLPGMPPDRDIDF
ncbi:uncharacterized protein [Nicotiana sylvestris]|uniref:uncharacterized protein n=1 Tax=Nicotiana sylvestris TaxID=4096 RepID=UPI00388CB6C7